VLKVLRRTFLSRPLDEQPGKEEKQRHVEAVHQPVRKLICLLRNDDAGAVQAAPDVAKDHQQDADTFGAVHPRQALLLPGRGNWQPVDRLGFVLPGLFVLKHPRSSHAAGVAQLPRSAVTPVPQKRSFYQALYLEGGVEPSLNQLLGISSDQTSL